MSASFEVSASLAVDGALIADVAGVSCVDGDGEMGDDDEVVVAKTKRWRKVGGRSREMGVRWLCGLLDSRQVLETLSHLFRP